MYIMQKLIRIKQVERSNLKIVANDYKKLTGEILVEIYRNFLDSFDLASFSTLLFTF